MVNSQKTARPNSMASAEQSVLTDWREEIRSFVEQTVQEIQRVVSGLSVKPREAVVSRPTEPRPAEAPLKRPAESKPTVELAKRSNHGAAAAASASLRGEPVDSIDASRTRLENLKRRLSEQLRTQQASPPDGNDRPRQESHS